MRTCFALLLACVASIPAFAHAPAAISTRPNVEIALATGWMDQRFADRLEAVLAANKQVRVLELESPGGHVAAAYRAARLLNRRGIEARVRGSCASACAILWSATHRRALFTGARLGLHRGEFAREPEVVPVELARQYHERRKTETLAAAGFPTQLIEAGQAVPTGKVLWINAVELKEAGVDFRLIESNGK